MIDVDYPAETRRLRFAVDLAVNVNIDGGSNSQIARQERGRILDDPAVV